MAFTIEGWVGAWPLFCSRGTCPGRCLLGGDFLPFVLFHMLAFYGPAAVITLMKRRNLWPDHSGLDKKFDSTWHVAYHFPMTFLAGPMVYMALTGVIELWNAGDLRKMYGAGASPAINDAVTWFVCYFVLDSFFVIVHGLGTMATYIHHLAFGVLIILLVPPCSCQFTAGLLVAQEISSPALNTFTLLRAYKGTTSWWTKGMFCLFAFLFFVFRVVVNPIATVLLVIEVGRSMTGDSNFDISLFEQVLVTVCIVAAAGLQMYWFYGILQKLRKLLFPSSRRSTKTEDDAKEQVEADAVHQVKPGAAGKEDTPVVSIGWPDPDEPEPEVP